MDNIRTKFVELSDSYIERYGFEIEKHTVKDRKAQDLALRRFVSDDRGLNLDKFFKEQASELKGRIKKPGLRRPDKNTVRDATNFLQAVILMNLGADRIEDFMQSQFRRDSQNPSGEEKRSLEAFNALEIVQQHLDKGSTNKGKSRLAGFGKASKLAKHVLDGSLDVVIKDAYGKQISDAIAILKKKDKT